MRGGAQVKEALGFLTLLWKYPILTGLLIFVFTPPFFPLVVYFSPLLMSTALCVVALVSVGSQMEKIKAEGGPGQLESHLHREHGVSTWAPRDRSENESMGHHYGRNLYVSRGINIDVVPAPPSWTGGSGDGTGRATVELRPELVENQPPSPVAEESDEDWLDKWVKEYESRPGWGEHEDQSHQTLSTPAIQSSTTSQMSQPPAPLTITTPITQERREDEPSLSLLKPVRQEIIENKPRSASSTTPFAAPVAAPVVDPVAAPVSAPISVSVVNRQEVLRSLPPPPTTSTSRSQEEVVVAVKESDLRSHISLAPIRTGREKRDARQVNRIGKTAHEIQALPTKSVETSNNSVARVSDVQALQSIEKLLHMEMGGSNLTPSSSLARNAAKSAGLGNSNGSKPQISLSREEMSPQLNAKGSEMIEKEQAMEALEKNRNKMAGGAAAPVEDIAGETPLLRHLKSSRSEKQSRNSSAYSPLPLRTSRGLMSEKVLPPPQFSPRLLQSLQPLPPKGFSPRLLPNSSTTPLGNPVEKIPQWVYDGIPRDRGESQIKQAETLEDKHVQKFEQAVKVLSHTRRRTHARLPTPIQVSSAGLQGRLDVHTPHSIPATTRKERTPEHMPASRRGSPHRASAAKPVVAQSPAIRISDDFAAERAHGAGDRLRSSGVDSTERASVACSPRISPTAAASPHGPMAAVSPQKASAAASPWPASVASSPRTASMAASPRGASVASSPQQASIAASPQRSSAASSTKQASIAASPRRASVSTSSQKASIATSPRRASVSTSPQKASIAASPRRASVALSPRRAAIAATPWPSTTSSPLQAPIAVSPQPGSRAPSPRRTSAASSPHRSSVPSSPSMPHSRRRKQSSKHATDKTALRSPSVHRTIELPTYYDAPPAPAKENSVAGLGAGAAEEYIPIEKEVRFLPNVEVMETLDANATRPQGEFPAQGELHFGRSFSAPRKSRRRLEPRRVVTSQDTDMFSLKKSFSLRNGRTINFVDSSSDDEHGSVTPRASRSLGRTIKPLVWRSRSRQTQEDSD